MGQDLMKGLLLSMPLLALAAVISGCSSGDIEVKSDLGEVSLVKESAVTSYSFDKENAKSITKKFINMWNESKNDCLQSEYLGKEYCDESYNPFIRENEDNLNLINDMPDTTIVKYRTIDTNVNGDKIASGYKYVSCIPKGETENRIKWAKIISKIDGVEAEPQKEISDNLLDDGLVVSSVQIKVCENYGNI